MSKTFLKGMYYIPKDSDENPYSILKNANKNNLNFIIIEYTNKYLFDNFSSSKFSKLVYIQNKIEAFEKKYKNTVGLICFKCNSIIGPIRILLSKSIFRGEIFKLKNFYLWCYLNNPTLILSNNNYTHIENDNIKKYFTLYFDNFVKSTDNYLSLLNKGLNITPIYINNGFIFIRNNSNDLLDFKNLKQYISSQIKNGKFYISNLDRFYLDYSISYPKNKESKILSIKLTIDTNEMYNQQLLLLDNNNNTIINKNLYNLKHIYYRFEIKNSANKFIIFKIFSKNNLFALTYPIYMKN